MGGNRRQQIPGQRPKMSGMGGSIILQSRTALQKVPKPGETFRKLPQEVLLVILAELRKLHIGSKCQSCSTCWMREVVDLGLTCKKWWDAAQVALYEDIQLNGVDSLVHTKKKYKMKYGTRLILLRRTLRARPEYAQYIKSLKVPAMPEIAKSKSEQDMYMDLVASVIMACPNLERLPGFYPTYAHEFSRFVHALSTRPKMTEMVWIINPSRFQRQHRYKVSEDIGQATQLLTRAPGLLLPGQTIDFLTYHSKWSNLTTLFLQCNPGGTIDSPLFVDVCDSLPKLENLYVSNFPATSFNDSTLVALPPLKSLRLDRLSGVTCDGLSALASTIQRHTLQSLSLISIPLLSLTVLARIMSNFRSLTSFTISQSPAPSLAPGEIIFLHPYLASASLIRLHWEFTNADRDTATAILSKSIEFGGFPSLRNIRAPTDFEGLLQMHCRPRERIELASDRFRNLKTPTSHTGLHQSYTGSATSLPSPTRSTFGAPVMPSPTRSTFSLGHGSNTSVSSSIMKSPTRSAFSQPGDYFSLQPDDTGYKGISLCTARRMAQHRIEASTTQPQFHIIVWDDSGHLLERFEVGGYIGKVHSKVFYSVKPDVDGMDEAVVQFEGVGGLLDTSDETGTKEKCTGAWFLDFDPKKHGKPTKKKDVWWHTERGRWRDLPLETFF